MRSPASGRFGEWQHPAVKAALHAGPDRRRVVALQAQILLGVAFAAPLLTRFLAATWQGMVSPRTQNRALRTFRVDAHISYRRTDSVRDGKPAV